MSLPGTSRSNLLTAIVGINLLLPSGLALSQNVIQPVATIRSDNAVLVEAQPNYVISRPEEREAPIGLTISRSAYLAAKAQADSSRAPGSVKPLLAALSPESAPVIKDFNFNGHSSTEGLRPPDTHGAVGSTYFVEVTNSHIDMWLRKSTGPVLQKSVTLATFFNYTTQTIFDPRVVYDSTWNRWIITADAFPESSTVQKYLIAVSSGPDPTLSFFTYKIDIDIFDNNDLWDFPQLGIDQDAVLFTANIFANAGSGGFVGADFFAIAKSRLYNGQGFAVPIFTGLVGTLAPPIVLDQNASTFLIAAPTSGTVFTKYTATNTSHPGATSLVSSTITVTSYSIPPDAHQPGIPDLLDTQDCRFANASTQSGDDLWQTHTVNLSGFPAPVFYRLSTSTDTIIQSGFYFVSGSSDDFNCSITANATGDCFVTYTSTNAGAGLNPQVRLSGKLNAETSIPAGPLAVTSPDVYNASSDTTERWGDYSAITVDPLNSSIAWLVNERVTVGGVLWGSRIVRISF
jgi:hypothetical protein